jgi:hypothetical protein
MVVAMDLLMNNLLGRSSSDATPVAFMPWDTLHARVTQGITASAVGDLLILRAVNNLTHQQEEIFRINREREERDRYEESRRILGEEKTRSHDEWLATQRLHGRPPPLERRPGESEAVFQLKAEARAEFLREFGR